MEVSEDPTTMPNKGKSPSNTGLAQTVGNQPL